MDPRSPSDLVSFWLLPGASAHGALSAIIAELAQRFTAPSFEPHITLFAKLEAGRVEGEDWVAIANAAVEGVEPFKLHASGLGHSDDVFKAVYFAVADNRELREIHRRISSRLPCGYVLKPHLSLIYKELAAPVRERLCQEIEGRELPSQWLADAVTVVVPGAGGWARVPDWREVHRISLR